MRLIFTKKTNGGPNRYIHGAGVGAKSTSVRRALRRSIKKAVTDWHRVG